MSEFEFAKLPDDHALSPEDAKRVEDALVSDTSELKVKIPNVPDLSDLIPGTNLPRFKRNRPAPPLEEYVAFHVAETKKHLARGLKDPQQFTEPTPGDDRVSRAEKYARWRWQGYIDGEIASL